MKVVIIVLFLSGLAVAQDAADEVVTEAPAEEQPVAESTIEPPVSDANELSTSEDETKSDGVLEPADPNNSTSMTTTECAELNRRRNNLLECCEYPHIKYYDVFAKYCVDECVGVKDVCCSQICVWRKTKIINEEGAVNVEGLKDTLMESVLNKAEWTDLVEKNVAICAEECK